VRCARASAAARRGVDGGDTIGGAMIDAKTGQVRPCPICNSVNVRWRGRRPYDVPLTWSRHFIEMLFSSTMASTPRRSARVYRERLVGELLEARTGGRTATAFWRCPDCRNKGDVFDQSAKRSRVEDRTRPPV
jgi:hypothetical protein